MSADLRTTAASVATGSDWGRANSVGDGTPTVGSWLEDPGFGVYVHFPFCLHRCHYCDFNAYEGQHDLHAPYVGALLDDIGRFDGDRGPATSVFFGGGTPTVLEPADLALVLRAVTEGIGIAPGAEVTVEANPETVDERKFEALLAAGFNRFSIGVQSLVSRVLKGLGRTHSPGVALRAVRAARRAGVTNLNVDLIYGSAWETPADWARSLDGVIEERPDHISAYALTVEDGTPLATLVATGRVADVDPDVQWERYMTAQHRLSAAGYVRYEISNWATPGMASSHNVLYWSAGDYAGFGAGAHGHLGGHRWWTRRLPRDFIAAVDGGCSPEQGSEMLPVDARAGEALVLGLRLRSGVELAGFVRRFGHDALADRAGPIADLESLGVLEISDGWLRLADSATLVSSDVSCRLL